MHDYIKLYDEYLNGKTIKQISKENGSPVTTFYTAFKRMGLDTKQGKRPSQEINHKFFEEINDEASAYYLGFWYADGYTLESTGGKAQKMLSMKLQKQDCYILQKFLDVVYPNGKIDYRDNVATIKISSDKLVNDLHRNGCTKKKTRVFTLPNVSKELVHYFLRGFFDGDGSISIRKERPNQVKADFCSINYEVLSWIQSKLLEDGIKTRIYTEKRNGKTYKTPSGYSSNCVDMHRLVISTFCDNKKLFDYLYNGENNYHLTRKYEKYKNWAENVYPTVVKK